MVAKGAVFAILVIAISTCALAQKNEASISAGAVATSNQQTMNLVFTCPVFFPNCGGPFRMSTDPGVAFEGDYVREIFNFHAASLGAEFPILGIPGRDVTTTVAGGQPPGIAPFANSYSSIFFTPSARIKFLPGGAAAPFLSLGGGFAWHIAGTTVRRGALQFGGGVDFKTPLPHLGIRAEVRDFLAKRFLENTTGSLVSPERLHNVFAGVGVVVRF
jgi:hypothetical protein